MNGEDIVCMALKQKVRIVEKMEGIKSEEVLGESGRMREIKMDKG